VIRQLAFDLPSAEAMTRDHFFVAPSNALALQTVEHWQDWPGRKLLLVGPEGAGKTHLAHIWAALAGAAILPARTLSDRHRRTRRAPSWSRMPTASAGPRRSFSTCTTCHRDGRAASDRPHPAARLGPDAARPEKPDAGHAIAQLDGPDDALLSAVLVKLFADRQVAVPANLIPYLVSRMPRSIGARALVAALDARALAEARPITRAWPAKILGT
jgi:chromosomal replication initiation ATPase DnaA